MLELVYCDAPKGSLVVEADVKNIDAVLAYVENDMAEHKLPNTATSKLMVASEEIFSNIAQYAYKTRGLARIYTYIENGMYHICFTDNGADYNPQDRETPDLSRPAEERDIGGLGIFLVKKSVDDIRYEYRDGKNVLTICKKL